MDSSATASMDFHAMGQVNVSKIISRHVGCTSIGTRRLMRASVTQDMSESVVSASQLAIAQGFPTGMDTNVYVSRVTSSIQLFKDASNSLRIRFVQHSALSTEFSAAAIQVTSPSGIRHVVIVQLDSIGLDALAHQIKFVTQIIFGTLRQTLVDLFLPSVESMKNGTVLSVYATTFMTE